MCDYIHNNHYSDGCFNGIIRENSLYCIGFCYFGVKNICYIFWS